MALTIFWLWNRNSELRHDLKNSTEQPDTIWVNKPLVPKVEFPKIQLPKMVFLYQIDSVPIERIEYVDRATKCFRIESYQRYGWCYRRSEASCRLFAYFTVK